MFKNGWGIAARRSEPAVFRSDFARRAATRFVQWFTKPTCTKIEAEIIEILPALTAKWTKHYVLQALLAVDIWCGEVKSGMSWSLQKNPARPFGAPPESYQFSLTDGSRAQTRNLPISSKNAETVFSSLSSIVPSSRSSAIPARSRSGKASAT